MSAILLCEGLIATHSRSVLRRPIILVIVSDLVKIILVELPHEAGEIAMFEMFGENGFGELLVLERVRKLLQSQWPGLVMRED